MPIAGAALDVTDPEPLPPDDPLWSAPNLLVAPHIGSATRATRERMTEIAVGNLLAALDGSRCRFRPTASPTDAAMRIAIVDVGTNTTRLFIAELQRAGSTASSSGSAASPGWAPASTGGRLLDEAIARELAVLDDYADTIAGHGGDSARRGDDECGPRRRQRPEFGAGVAARYGLDVHVLSGDDEARLTYLGATDELDPTQPAARLVIDIGGGSTELVLGHGRTAEFHVSTPGRSRPPERPPHRRRPADRGRARRGRRRRARRARTRGADRLARRGGARARGRGNADLAGRDRPTLDPYDPSRVHGSG